MPKDTIDTNQSMYSFAYKASIDNEWDKLSYYGRKFTSKQMFEEVDKIAYFLQKRVAVGESVAICLPNIPQAIFCFYAINKIGAVANIIHPKIKPTALINILEQTNCKWIFMFDKFLSTHKRLLQQNGVMTIACNAFYYAKNGKILSTIKEKFVYTKNTINYTDIVKEGINDLPLTPQGGGQSVAVLLHSSGTTGEAKTVLLSNYAFNELASNVYSLVTTKVDVKPDDGMLMILPLFHGFGLGICVHLMMFYGRIILLPMFKEKNVIKIMKKEKVQIISGVPSMFRRLSSYKKFGGAYLQHLKMAFCGGDKLESSIKQDFENILLKYGNQTKIMEGYGLSETASVVTINIDGKDDGSLGVPLPNVDIRIEDGGNICKAGEVGEIVINTPSIMMRYLNGKNPFVVDRVGRKWLYTGDKGYLDNQGKLFYKGREKRMLKIGGVNIFPQEVERKVEEIKEISYACAVRIIWQNKPALKLIVVPKNGKLTQMLKTRINNKIKEELLPYAVPKIIEKADKMVLTVMGKVDYKHYEKLEENINY